MFWQKSESFQSSVSELESQVGNIKDETTTDVDEIVDGFDILIDSLNTVSFDLDDSNSLDEMKRRRRSSGQSKLISKIHQLAETFKKMRMSVRDTEERIVSNLNLYLKKVLKFKSFKIQFAWISWEFSLRPTIDSKKLTNISSESMTSLLSQMRPLLDFKTDSIILTSK